MSSDARRFNPWPYAIITAIGLFVCGVVTLVVVASSDRTELVSKDYYEQEIRYQARVDQIRRTEPLADQIGVDFDKGTRQVRIRLPREHAAIGATGRVQFYRPSQSTDDHSYAISVDGEGRQSLSGTELAGGLWKVRLGWTAGGLDYYADRELVVAAPQGASKL